MHSLLVELWLCLEFKFTPLLKSCWSLTSFYYRLKVFCLCHSIRSCTRNLFTTWVRVSIHVITSNKVIIISALRACIRVACNLSWALAFELSSCIRVELLHSSWALAFELSSCIRVEFLHSSWALAFELRACIRVSIHVITLLEVIIISTSRVCVRVACVHHSYYRHHCDRVPK
jgi:hypothetical protein